jgi:N6-L-threonylcarbamoyladenine synthase
VIDVVIDRTRFAFGRFRANQPHEFPRFVMAGGVAANTALRSALAKLCSAEGFAMSMPPVSLCTDNAAMVAWVGIERAAAGLFDDLSFPPRARWPLRDLTGATARRAEPSSNMRTAPPR